MRNYVNQHPVTRTLSYDEFCEEQYSDSYAEYIMKNASGDSLAICNGDMLLQAMERGYLFEDYLMNAGLEYTE